MKVEIKVLDKRIDGVEFATPGAAAVDLRACSIIDDGGNPVELTGYYILHPGKRVKIGTGIAIHIGSMTDEGVPICGPMLSAAALLLPRSGAGWRGFELANTVGLIDEDYQGELILAACNGGNFPLVFAPLERLGQMVIVPVIRPQFVRVSEFGESTERGAGGFGSTGGV